MVLMNNSGEGIDERRVSNNEINQYLEKNVPHHTCAVMEATRNWAFMVDQILHQVDRVEIAHPKELVEISPAAVNADRI